MSESGMLRSTVDKAMWMRRARSLTFALVMVAAVLAAGVVALVGTTKPAEAAFPGANGKIVFVSDRTTGTGVDNPTGDKEIFTMNDDGTGLTQLTHNTSSWDLQPAWSADGTQIAFMSNRPAADNTTDYEIYKMDADGENEVPLTNNAVEDSNPAWSPVLSSGGTKIAFTSTRDGYYDLYMMSSNGSNQVRLTKNTNLDARPAWSPNGTRIAFHSNRSGNYEVYAMKPRPEGKRNRPVNLSRHSSSDEEPNWSPDGTQIAFLSKRGVGGDNEIYKMDVDGTDQSPLTENGEFDSDPTWSPDGTQITFFRLQQPNSFEVFKIDANGDNPDNLTENAAHDSQPDWQPIP